MVGRGQWQRPARNVVVRHSGSLTTSELIECELLAQGERSVAAGLTAANLDGLKNFPSATLHVLVPHGSRVVRRPGVVIHRTRILGPADIHPTRTPRRTRLSRSVVDAASWVTSELQTQAILAASVQQGLVTPEHLDLVLSRMLKVPRRSLIVEALSDIRGGSLSEYEIMFARMCRRRHLPLPSRQVQRSDASGKSRYLDAYFDDYHLVAEIDGQQHMEPLTWWDDMARGNDLVVREGMTILRFPGFVLRHHEDKVATQLRQFFERSDHLQGFGRR